MGYADAKLFTLVIAALHELFRVEGYRQDDFDGVKEGGLFQEGAVLPADPDAHIFSSFVFKVVDKHLYLASLVEPEKGGSRFNLHAAPEEPGNRVLRFKMKAGSWQVEMAEVTYDLFMLP